MLQKIKSTALMLGAVFALVAPAAVPAFVSADTTTSTDLQGNLNCGADLTLSTDTATCAKSGSDAPGAVDNIIKTAINIFSIVVGIIAVIMIIVGGLKYITSGGESSNVSSAKNTILYAIIGLVIVALAQIIVKFVLSKVTAS